MSLRLSLSLAAMGVTTPSGDLIDDLPPQRHTLPSPSSSSSDDDYDPIEWDDADAFLHDTHAGLPPHR